MVQAIPCFPHSMSIYTLWVPEAVRADREVHAQHLAVEVGQSTVGDKVPPPQLTSRTSGKPSERTTAARFTSAQMTGYFIYNEALIKIQIYRT